MSALSKKLQLRASTPRTRSSRTHCVKASPASSSTSSALPGLDVRTNLENDFSVGSVKAQRCTRRTWSPVQQSGWRTYSPTTALDIYRCRQSSEGDTGVRGDDAAGGHHADPCTPGQSVSSEATQQRAQRLVAENTDRPTYTGSHSRED